MLLYGEDLNDTKALAELIGGLAPDLGAMMEPRREPLVLMRNAPVAEIAGRAERIAAAVNGERQRFDVLCVFAHEDTDAVEPSHERLARTIEEALAAAGCEAHAAVPACEIEAWWFMWPDAVQSVVASWRRPDEYLNRRVGLITDPKEKLKRSVVRELRGAARTRVRTYRESDSVAIARFVREQGLAATPGARSDSYARFRQSVGRCADGLERGTTRS